jgi:hypothetical protein
MRSPSLFMQDYAASQDRFTAAVRDRELVLGTLGPAGTSSHAAALILKERMAELDPGGSLHLRLSARFTEVLTALLDGSIDLALVPSAYHGATAFHWHPRLRLLLHFASSTPDYGLVLRPGGRLPNGRTPTVAVMDEVRVVLDDLWPRVQPEGPVVVAARSTAHAAQLLVDGSVDVALTNDSTRQQLGLDWVTSRPGVPVVWMVFEATTTDR